MARYFEDSAKDNQITFLQLRCKALEEENERLKLRVQFEDRLNRNGQIRRVVYDRDKKVY